MCIFGKKGIIEIVRESYRENEQEARTREKKINRHNQTEIKSDREKQRERKNEKHRKKENDRETYI